MARKLVVEVVGDASSFERSLKSANRSAQTFSKEMGRVGRGAAAGSGVFRGLGRSIAFASGGFLAFASAGHFLRESVDAARDAAVSQRSLAAQMKTSGAAFGDFRDRIEEAANGYAKLGFNSEQYIQSLTVLDRGTRNINQAMRLQGLSADIARAKGIDLSAAAQTVAKVFGGQETALRRAVPGLSKTAHGWDLIRQAQQRMAGQARAGTTAAEQFGAAWFNTQKIVGQALLPILNRLLGRLTRWLQRAGNQQKIADAFKTAADAVQSVYDAFNRLAGVVGGWKNLLAGAAGAWLGFKAAGVGAAVTVELANIAAAAGTAAAWRAALISTGWGAFAVAAGIAAAYVVTHWQKVKKFFAGLWIYLQEGFDNTALAIVEAFSHLPKFLGGGPFQRAKAALKADLKDLEAQAAKVAEATATPAKVRGPKLPRGGGGGGFPGVGTTAAAAKKQAGPSVLDLLEFNVDKATMTATLADDLAALRKLEAYLRQRIAHTRNNLDLRRKLLDAEKQVQGILKQQADLRRQARQRRAERQAAAREARQFGLLGLGPTGEDFVPGLRSLRTQLGQVRAAIKGTILDTPKEMRLLGRVADLIAGRFGKLGPEVRQKIHDMLAAINQELGKGTGELSKWAHTSSQKILAGLGLSPQQRRELNQRLATIGPGMTVPPHHTAAFAGAGGTLITGNTMHFHGVQDVKGLEQQLTKRHTARAHTRRGAR
ncbi:MAG: hypothetical protein E6J91_45785 [Deltaproteobacteria bacterium]|nr:MAG: hypothetical protein E6J91_45785 [Deltaproteobacteria bacterium]